MASALSSNSGGTNFKRLLMSPPFLIIGAIIAAAAVFLFIRHQQSGVAAAAQVGANNSRTGPTQSGETLATGTLGSISDTISQLSQDISTLAAHPSPIPAPNQPAASQPPTNTLGSTNQPTTSTTPTTSPPDTTLQPVVVPPAPVQSTSIFAAAAAPAPATPVAGAYLTTSLGEKQYAAHVTPAPTTGPGIIASIRQAILPAPKPAAVVSSPFSLQAQTNAYYVARAAAPTAQGAPAAQAFRASERASEGAGVPYVAPAAVPAGHSKLSYF